MPLTICETSLAQFRDGASVSDRREHVLQRLTCANVTMDVVGRDERKADSFRIRHPALQLSGVVRSVMQLSQQISSVAERFVNSLNVAVTLRVTS